ncbi:MAG: hypothetical protein J6A90_00835 [Clostridia bacterium]|nr:hypothetical protein [Clostridia bacterium]
MSENNLSDIISSLAANKDFASMVERVKESGDISSIFGEVASLLGTDGENSGAKSENSGAKSENITQSEDSLQETSTEDTINNTQEIGAESEDTDSEAQKAGVVLGKTGGKGDEFDTGSLLSGILPLFARSITENSALLLALKPYLSKKRCELIDSIIKISKLASIVSLAK